MEMKGEGVHSNKRSSTNNTSPPPLLLLVLSINRDDRSQDTFS